MRIGVFGSSGMLGHVLVKFCILSGIDVVPLSRRNLPGDLSRISYLPFDVESYNADSQDFDYVINCCGLIKQRNSSENDFYKVNQEFPKKLASKYGKRMIHISTDCVFSGNKGKYIESDIKDASDAYGLSKSGGEEINARILRTSIIGTHPEDSNGLLEWARSQRKKSVNGYADHFWGGVTTLELSKHIISEIESIDSQSLKHVYSERVSKFDMLQMISGEFDLDLSISKIYTGKVDRSLSTMFEGNISKKNLSKQLQDLREFERIKV